MSLDSRIEAILFYKAEPVHITALTKMLTDADEGSIRTALVTLENSLHERGIRLIEQNDSFILATAPEVGELLETITKQELQKDLGKASVESLTVILYKGPVSKSEIDYIRGVNSGFILRNLLIRGLINRAVNPRDKRTFLYTPSVDLLSYLGITKVEELPQFNDMREKVDAFEKSFGNDKNE